MTDQSYKPVYSIEHFNDLVSSSRNKVRSKNINCYLLAEEIEIDIANSCFFYDESDAGLLIFREYQSAYYLYLFVNVDIVFHISKREKPILADFVGKHDLDENNRKCINLLLTNGFSHYITARRMVKKYVSDDFMYNDFTQPESFYRIGFADSSEIDAIYMLWSENLDIIANPFSKKWLTEQIMQRNIICAKAENGDVIGTIQIAQAGKLSYIGRLAVLPEYRRKKIAQSMMNYCLALSSQKDISKIALWVENSNKGAISLYSKLGFEFDGMLSEQYLL